MIQGISRSGIESQWKIVLRSKSTSSDSKFSLLSRDKRLPLVTWNQSGSQENFFANQSSTFDSSQNHHQEIHHCTTPRETGSVPQGMGTGTSFARDEERIKDTIPMPTFARRPSTMSSLFPVGITQNSMVGQQRQHTSELQFDNFQHLLLYILVLEDKIQKPSDHLF